MKFIIIFLAALFIVSLNAQTKNEGKQGMYFYKKCYNKKALPNWDKTKTELPEPVYDDNPLFIKTYWKAWELAFKNFYEPKEGSGFVSQFIDAAFNQNIFLWDTGFMTMFCNYAYGLVPGIESLDNFYCKQHEDGEICREINRNTGIDFKEWINSEDKPLFSRWGWQHEFKNEPVKYVNREIPSPNPKLTLDALNHPILAWAELESYKITGNKKRLTQVYEPLKRYYFALKKYLLQGNGLYITDWASMDNSPRNPYLNGGGIGIDISAEMSMFASNLNEIAKITGNKKDFGLYDRDIKETDRNINNLCWNDSSKFYYDIDLYNKQTKIKTIAAFWTLLSGSAPKDRAGFLAAHLIDPNSFGTLHPVPTCSKDSEGYDSLGGYWRGAVWAPTNTMVIRGLEKYGYHSLAKEIALKHLILVSKVFESTGTIWENYEPEGIAPGKLNGKNVKGDFVGWSGIAPIMYFIEFAIGLKADAQKNEVVWNLNSSENCGCKKFRFNGIITDLIAKPDKNGKISIEVKSTKAYTLKIIRKNQLTILAIKKGNNNFYINF